MSLPSPCIHHCCLFPSLSIFLQILADIMLLSRRTFSCGFTSSPTRRISLRTGWPFRICGSIWKPCLLEETLPNNFLRYNGESFYRSNLFPKRGNIYSCGNTSGSLGEREIEVGRRARRASVSTQFEFSQTSMSVSTTYGNTGEKGMFSISFIK